jgi:dipeptidyl aminopeptidase/acylaminoacyl peptidase
MRRILFILATILIFSCTEKKIEIPQYTIDQFYKNVNVLGNYSFSDDETRLLINTNETGIYNLFELNLADSSKRAITNSTTESCYALDYVHGTKQLLYSADKGGNEISHIFLMDEKANVMDLTPGDKVKASFDGWSKDKKVMYFVSNKRDPKYFDLYSMNTGEWKEQMIYKNTDGYELSSKSKDRSLIALSRPVTTSESKLFLYNRATNKITEVSEEGKPGSYNGQAFSNDNRYFYYTTDAGKEFSFAVKYEIATGSREVVYDDRWDVSGYGFSENEKYRLAVVNEDGRMVVRIWDNVSGTVISYPDIPGSSISGLKISDSEKKMALLLGSSKMIGDVYLWEIGATEMKKLTSTMNPEIDPGKLVDAQVIRFKSFDSLEIPAIFYKPLMATKKNKIPALVYVHGGPGGQSMLYYDPLIQFLVNHGYAVLAVNNRGSSGYGKTFYKMDDRNHGDKDLRDCIWGKKWMQGIDYIDGAKIGIIGGSYGGFMTMAAMTSFPDEFKAGVNFFGVTNWIRTLRSTPPFWAAFRDALFQEMGDPFTADSVMLYQISPLFHGKNVKHPVLILQGANDPRVLKVESDEMVEAIKSNKVPVEYIVFPDEGHGFVKRENEIKANSQVLEFLDKYLKGTESN